MQQSRKTLAARWPFLVLLLLALVGFWQHQSIQDWVRLYNYDPPAPVVQLADNITVTPKARRLFYVNHPAIQGRSAFQTSCTNHDEHTIVLGCYHPIDRGIYVFHVSDPRLDGVDQVTAAHEMLHAAYDRLSSKERTRVNGLLQAYYDHDLHDDRVKTIIAAYRQSEPNDVLNEMHSVFGTEMANLPPALETYYQQYFTSRAKVVAYAASYQAEFTSRQATVASDDQQLQTMEQQITSNKAQLNSLNNDIDNLRSHMDNQRSDGDIAGYNSNVPVYNAKIANYNQLVTNTKSLISSYNTLVEQRNQLAVQVTELAQSINSSLQPIN